MNKTILSIIIAVVVVAAVALFLILKPAQDPIDSLEQELQSLEINDLDSELQAIEQELQNL
ncbi:MAG: hypothetical protein HYT03_02480 [Candidatus Harrisonbacteria bacterium]|nr:hypothetical protein [Candidatus Harrisonbacteria bacterium]